LDLLRRQSLLPPPRFDEMRIVFTPLHGVGAMTAMEVLINQGFRVTPVEEQMKPDGQFPNVTKSPNPEVPESMDRAEATAKSVDADLVLATDPDADVLWYLEKEGAYEDVRGTPEDFVIATEESHGILVTPHIRDKDAGGAALLMAELALAQKRQGRTVLDYLEALFRQFGYFRNDG